MFFIAVRKERIDLTKRVEVVCDVDELRFKSCIDHCSVSGISGHDLSHVPYMDMAGRGDSGRDQMLVAACFCFFGNDICPVCNFSHFRSPIIRITDLQIGFYYIIFGLNQ